MTEVTASKENCKPHLGWLRDLSAVKVSSWRDEVLNTSKDCVLTEETSIGYCKCDVAILRLSLAQKEKQVTKTVT